MRDFGVYFTGRRYKAAPASRGLEGLVTLAGGDTDKERLDRARRLADAFNSDLEAGRVEARARRLEKKARALRHRADQSIKQLDLGDVLSRDEREALEGRGE